MEDYRLSTPLCCALCFFGALTCWPLGVASAVACVYVRAQDIRANAKCRADMERILLPMMAETLRKQGK